MTDEASLAILGGSGFYDLPGLEAIERVDVATPFGAPSAPVVRGRVDGQAVIFLARHGVGHTLLPGEVNARANVWALKALGATAVLSVSAVGSLREAIVPGDVVTPRQFLDRTCGRAATFFGGGVVAHVSMASPVCDRIADALADAATGRGGVRVHRAATYVCVEGPRFSTRAESALFRGWGADVVGMTNLPEAFLAREAELCYATLALPTDYDCWRDRSEEVSVPAILALLAKNVTTARAILARTIGSVDPRAGCACHRALDTGLMTPPGSITPEARLRLGPILARRLGGG